MRYALNVATLNGYRTFYLSDVAAIALNAAGYTATQVAVSSTAALVEIQADGSVKKAKSLSGTASIGIAAGNEFPAFAKTMLIQPASIELTASHGIPSPMPVPDQFYLGLERNQIMVPRQDSTIPVNAVDRIISVQPQDRIIMVEREMSPP